MRVAVGIAGLVAAVATLKILSSGEPIRSSFALDHAVMLLTFVAAVESPALALCGLERPAGFGTTPMVHRIDTSRNVSEFR